MNDRLGRAEWINAPVRNPAQSMFRRFVKTPKSGLDDYLADSKKAWKAYDNKALDTRLEER